MSFALGTKIPRNPFPPHTTMRFLAIDKVIVCTHGKKSTSRLSAHEVDIKKIDKWKPFSSLLEVASVEIIHIVTILLC